ncbi:hypothetical protein GCM10027055_28390 [Janibacter alkaliphilus]|uniref:Uncharacterized protein n=1 Tax=Janibacter alkaliphilus TaxID=1069963 RepID=A0A852X139_9MICO|nr:hypothetical protein [Janibacter alkaliphilus]NYG36579.1 hypothetical protein [Janibacter alkaliphilus]
MSTRDEHGEEPGEGTDAFDALFGAADTDEVAPLSASEDASRRSTSASDESGSAEDAGPDQPGPDEPGADPGSADPGSADPGPADPAEVPTRAVPTQPQSGEPADDRGADFDSVPSGWWSEPSEPHGRAAPGYGGTTAGGAAGPDQAAAGPGGGYPAAGHGGGYPGYDAAAAGGGYAVGSYAYGAPHGGHPGGPHGGPQGSQYGGPGHPGAGGQSAHPGYAGPPPRRRGLSPLALIALLVVGVLVGALVMLGIIRYSGDDPAPTAGETVTTTETGEPPTSSEQPSEETTSSSSSSSTSTPTRSGELPSGATACASAVEGTAVARGNDVTSCAFATEVREAYLDQQPDGGDVEVRVVSPVTDESYTMRCTGRTVTVCTGGNNAVVYLY